jgi:hypothetical protein
LYGKKFTPKEWVGCLECSVYQGSKAARRRGSVNLYAQPLVLQVDELKSGWTNVVENPITPDERSALCSGQNDQTDQLAEGKPEEPI